MNVRKFFGPTSREALREVKAALGADAVVLGSRAVNGGVEITALAAAALAQLAPAAHADAPKRPRRLAIPQDELPPAALPATSPLPLPLPVAALGQPPSQPQPLTAEPAHQDAWARHLVNEIHALRGALEGRIEGLAWTDQQRREPVRARLLRDLLTGGFTPALARPFADGLPAGRTYPQAVQWAHAMFARNLQVAEEDAIVVRGGVYALVGPTGVGKTTTTAKLAARCVVRHGADKLALLTTDSYRVGGHEQLRIYGKILGVPVHVARDGADLRARLAELQRKHLVLIDTVGMSQRDELVAEQISMLAGCAKRLVLLPATAGAEQLQDVVRAYRGDSLHGAIITKTDESVSLAGALDTVLRYKLELHYIATGQRVPEDLHPAQRDVLARGALRAREAEQPGDLSDAEVPLILGAAVRAPAGAHRDGERNRA